MFQRPGLRQQVEVALCEAGACRQFGNVSITPRWTPRHEGDGTALREAGDALQPETHRPGFEHGGHVARPHIDRQHAHAMAARIPHQCEGRKPIGWLLSKAQRKAAGWWRPGQAET